MFVGKGRLEMTEPSQEGRVRVGRESYPVEGENKKVSTDRPLDQGRTSSGVGPMIAARGGREIAISGATGPPVDPPNLTCKVTAFFEQNFQRLQNLWGSKDVIW